MVVRVLLAIAVASSMSLVGTVTLGQDTMVSASVSESMSDKKASAVSIRVLYSKEAVDCETTKENCLEVFGSGFIVHESGYVLTNSHVAPPYTDYRFYRAYGKIGSKTLGTEFELKFVAPVKNIDLSILKFDSPRKYSTITLGDSYRIHVGDPLFAWGFPKGHDILLSIGHYSGIDLLEGLIIAQLEPAGMESSGSPVFASSDGHLIGMMELGTARARMAGPNVKYLIPADSFRHIVQGIYEYEQGISPKNSMVRVIKEERIVKVEKVIPISFEQLASSTALTPTTKGYSKTFKADEGFKIIEADIKLTSVRGMTDLRLETPKEKDSVTIYFSLTSGPLVDRYRGWIDGTLIVKQEKIEPKSVIASKGIPLLRPGSYLITDKPLSSLQSGKQESVVVDVTDGQGVGLAKWKPSDLKGIKTGLGSLNVEVRTTADGTYLDVDERF